MLQTIRDKTTGWVATAIVVVLIIPFAFWGINYYFTGGTEPSVAKVNDADIKYNEFQRAYTNYRQQMQSMLGNRALTPADEELLKQQTLNLLVESELLNQLAGKLLLTASDEQVRETIKNIDVFKAEGGFSKEFYERAVSMLGMPPAMYEEQMRLDMMSEQLQSAVIESEFVTRQTAEYVLRLTNQERDITYTIIPAEKFRESVEVSDEQVEKFYRENTSLYIKPEEIRIAYIRLSLDNLAEDEFVDEDDLRTYYEANKDKYDEEEQRQVTQIMLKVEENAAEDLVKKVKEEADKILAEIRSGKSFTELAGEYAENKEIDFSINEYGFLARGVLQPEVDETVYAMQKGEVSDVIRSKLGFHIVELVDIKGGEMNTFENSRAAVEQDYRRKQAEQRYFDVIDRLATASYEHPDTLEIASEETELSIEESDLFSRSGSDEGLTANPKIVEASFSEDVLMEGHNSEIIEISDTEVVVLRVIEQIPSARLPLEQVRDEIIDDIKFTEAGKLAVEIGRDVLADLKSGKDFETISNDRQIEWQEVADVKRSDISVNRAVLRSAFSLGQPQENKPVVGSVSLGTGDYAVIAVTAVKDPSPESIKETDIQNMRKELFALNAESGWIQFMETLKSSANIRIFQDRISGTEF